MVGPPPPTTPVIIGDAAGRRGGVGVGDIERLMFSPEVTRVDQAVLIAAATYTLPAVPDGYVRLIVRALCVDTPGAGVPPGDAQINVAGRDGDHTIAHGERTMSVVGLPIPAVAHVEGVLLLPGDELSLVCVTTMSQGCLWYIDVMVR